MLKTTAGALGSGIVVAGSAAGSEADATIDAEEIDTSDWEVTIESVEYSEVSEVSQSEVSTNVRHRSGNAETRVYVGENKDTDAEPVVNNSDEIGTESVGGTQSVVTWDVPDAVPVIGGDEASVDVTAELGLSGVDAGISLCIDGTCVDIGGFSLDLFEADLIRIEVKGAIKGVPFEVEGTLSVSASRSGFTPQLELGGSLELCLGRDLCDDDDEEDGWESVTCQLCKSRSASGSWP